MARQFDVISLTKRRRDAMTDTLRRYLNRLSSETRVVSILPLASDDNTVLIVTEKD
jgi:hypothetical protein